MIISTTNISVSDFGYHSLNDVYIYEQVDEPGKQEGPTSPHREFRLKPCPLRVSGNDGDGLEHA